MVALVDDLNVLCPGSSRLLDGGEAVGDDEHRAALHGLIQTALDGLLGRHQGAGGFIQQQDGRVAQHRLRNGETLELAAGEIDAPLLDAGVVAAGGLR